MSPKWAYRSGRRGKAWARVEIQENSELDFAEGQPYNILLEPLQRQQIELRAKSGNPRAQKVSSEQSQASFRPASAQVEANQVLERRQELEAAATRASEIYELG